MYLSVVWHAILFCVNVESTSCQSEYVVLILSLLVDTDKSLALSFFWSTKLQIYCRQMREDKNIDTNITCLLDAAAD